VAPNKKIALAIMALFKKGHKEISLAIDQDFFL
jgi:hypothetical protein